MKVGVIMERVVSNLKIRDLELMESRIQAFLGNISGTLVLYQNKKYIYVYVDNGNKYNDIYDYWNDNTIFNNYIYSAEGIADLCGWLYGVVQAKNKVV